MLKLKYRNELKHVITMADALIIKNRLSWLLFPDQSTGPNGSYHIRSLYFDTPDDKALLDKINGTAIKEKFRIRFYNHDHGFIMLEKKIKHYNKTAKLRHRLIKEEVEKLLSGDIIFLRDADQTLLKEFYVKLKTEGLAPKTVADYQREAYLYPAGNVRVTIDSNIKASINSTDLFDADLATAPVIDSSKCILEIKFDNFLPEFIQDIIQLNKCTSTAVSKYAACRLYM